MGLGFGSRASITFLTAFSLLAVAFSSSSAGDFAARSIGDRGNVTVMEFTGNYDAMNPDGTINAEARQAVAKEFYRLHKDDYDFLVIFTNFDFTMPKPQTIAFYSGIKNDTKGIGLDLFNNSVLYGSNNRLQGTIDMGNIGNLERDPLTPLFQSTLDTISHEMMHRWAAHVTFKDQQGGLSRDLLGEDGSHWSFLLSTDASLMYGNTWKDNGNGTFTSIRARRYYSPLDLYLMGFIDKSQVPPMLLINNPDIDPTQFSAIGMTIPGSPRYISVNDIIAAEGERIPGPAESQKTFKTAFILITTPGTFTGDEIYGLENIRNGWITRYSVLTDGAGLVQVSPSLLNNIPVNPGIVPPVITPRTEPSNIADAVNWLIKHQQSDGCWMDSEGTMSRDTAEVVSSLEASDVATQNLALGLECPALMEVETTDYLSREISLMTGGGHDANSVVAELIARQNSDGGWGTYGSVVSSATDTALALNALAKAGYGAQTVISDALV